MNRMNLRFSFRRAQAAQTIYQTMLGISCVALAIAIFFPVYEYMTQYNGPFKPYKFASASYVPRRTAAPARPAPKAKPAAKPGAGAKKEGETAPAATEAPKPIEKKPVEKKNKPAAPKGG